LFRMCRWQEAAEGSGKAVSGKSQRGAEAGSRRYSSYRNRTQDRQDGCGRPRVVERSIATMKAKTVCKTESVCAARHAVIYARVSSKDQEKEGYSIPAQLELLRGYAGAHCFEVLKEFTDVETAKAAGRTSFGEM